jgi:hypothetical protein
MSCAFGIIAVPSRGKAVSDVGVSVGMGHLLIDTILEIVKIFEMASQQILSAVGGRLGQALPLIAEPGVRTTEWQPTA